MAKCRECSLGELEILGTSGFGDLIEVECKNPECNEITEAYTLFEFISPMVALNLLKHNV